jgi:hypothetical protein
MMSLFALIQARSPLVPLDAQRFELVVSQTPSAACAGAPARTPIPGSRFEEEGIH